jgi:hypothetical protein
MQSSIKGLIWILCLTIPMMAWLVSEGDISHYLTGGSPNGQGLYVFCKIVGLYAYLFLWLHIMAAMVRNTLFEGIFPSFNKSLHRLVGISLSIMMLAHALLFMSAVSLRKGSVSWSTLVPNFADYYHTLLGLGVTALWLLPVLIVTGLYTARNRSAINAHRLSFVIFAMIFVHGLGVGSETKNGPMFYLYCTTALSVVLVSCVRLLSVNRKGAFA